MHQVIRVLVFAKNNKEALEKATENLENLCGERGEPFDYFVTFNDETAKMPGKARWGNLPIAVKATSKKGKEWIAEGMENTKRDFKRHLSEINNWIANFNEEDLFEGGQHVSEFDKYGVDFKYACYCVGEYAGSGVWLYDNDGEGIRDTGHLNSVLEKWGSIYKGEDNPYKDFEVWVVPADVHS